MTPPIAAGPGQAAAWKGPAPTRWLPLTGDHDSDERLIAAWRQWSFANEFRPLWDTTRPS